MKKIVFAAALLTFSFALMAGGCRDAGQKAPDKPGAKNADTDPKAQIRENLAKLSPEDRKLAEAQKFCAVNTKSRLGSMGVPIKEVIKGQPVFLCCDMCIEKARQNPDQTLEQVKKNQAK